MNDEKRMVERAADWVAGLKILSPGRPEGMTSEEVEHLRELLAEVRARLAAKKKLP